MKCPKCGYISFDFNQVCPKCDRELANEQKKLNLPFFRPEPPQLLGILTGDVFDAQTDIHVDESESDLREEDIQELYEGPEDALAGKEDEMLTYGEEEELDVVSLELDEEPALDMEDIYKKESEDVSPAKEHKEEDLLDILIENDSETVEEVDNESYVDSKTLNNDMLKEDIGDIEKEKEIPSGLDDISFEDLVVEEADRPESEKFEYEDAPVTDIDFPEDGGTMESFYLDSNAEGLTKEIDMKKFRKDRSRKDDKEI